MLTTLSIHGKKTLMNSLKVLMLLKRFHYLQFIHGLTIIKKKYPTVISSIKYENDTLAQENLISIIYFPKDEIELIIIGNKITYKQPIEDKTKNEDTELSEPINSETTPLDDREEINRDVVNNASQTNTTNVSTPQTLSIFDNYFEISNQFSLSFINPTKIPLSYSLNML